MKIEVSKITPKMYVVLRNSQYGKIFDHTEIRLTQEEWIPKKIYMYWHSSFENAPDVCKRCAESWHRQNPDWDVVLLDAERATAIVSRDCLPADIPEPHYSDLLRLKLLSLNGGVWADATLFCTAPLGNWLPLATYSSNFFAFQSPRYGRVVANWFMAAKRNSIIAQEMLKLLISYWEAGGSPKYYFCFHSLFEYLLETSNSARAEWDAAARVTARAMFYLQDLRNPPTRMDIEFVQAYPMQKLNHARGFDASLLQHFVR